MPNASLKSMIYGPIQWGNTSLFYLFIDKERDNPFQTGVLEPTVTGSECPSKAIV